MTKDIKAVYQGAFNSLNNIKVSPLSRAYLFADSIYEVIPFQNKKFIYAQEHLERLIYSSSQVKIKIDIERVKNEIFHLLEESDIQNGYIYYQVSRGIDITRSHIYDQNISPETFGYLMPLDLDFKKQNLTVSLCADIRWSRCDIKTTSLLGNVIQMNSVSEEGCDEIIMHRDGLLTEGGASNIFFVKEEKIFTPQLSSNILPGITRAILIEIIKENNLPFEEGEFYIDDLKEASSIWFTSSTKGIAAVKRIIDLDIELNPHDALLKKCQSLYKEKVSS